MVIPHTALNATSLLHSINNAGFTWDGVLHKITPEQWDVMLSVHCTAPFRLVQAASPHMRDAAKKARLCLFFRRERPAGGVAAQECLITCSASHGLLPHCIRLQCSMVLS